MGGFYFGAISYLDPTKTLICFLFVIAFVITFEVVIGVMEYYLEGSTVYNRMVQMIYKELMLMGVVSFIVIMIQAARTADSYDLAQKGSDWILGIDYSHIVLFFLTFFFVVHAFYFMRQSILSASRYRNMYSVTLPNLIKELEFVQANPQSSFFYYLQYLPLSHLRDKVEFFLTLSLFRDTYWLPVEFNYADYLSGCYSRYALRTIDRSFFTWGIILLLVILNYTREVFGMRFDGCGQVVHGDDDGGGGGGHRRLSGAPPESTEQCVHGLLKLFLLAASMLCLFTLFMMYISRIYKIRMMCRIGFDSPSEYIDFLKFSEKQDEKDKIAKMIHKNARGAPERDRMTMEELKRDIERVLDEDEHEEEPEFKALAEFLSSSWQGLKDLINSTNIQIHVCYKWARAGFSSAEVAAAAPMLSSLMARKSECSPHISPEHSPKASPRATRASFLLKHPSAASNIDDHSGLDVTSSSSPRLDRKSSTLHGAHSDEDHSSEGHDAHHASNKKAQMVQRLTMHSSPRLNEPAKPSTVIPMQEEPKPKPQPQPQPPTPVTVTTPAVTPARPSATSPVHNKGHRASVVGDRTKVMDMLNQINFAEADMGSSKHGGLVAQNSKVNNNRRNSVAVHAPDNNYSTIEKFRKQKFAEKRQQLGDAYRANHIGSPRSTLNSQTNKSNKNWLLSFFDYNKVDPEEQHDVEAHNADNEFRLSSDFSDIFMWNKPELFYGAVEVCIMFNCLYMAFWVTDFICLAAKLDQPPVWHVFYQLAMAIPAVLVLPFIGYIIETCSLLRAISDLNLDVVHGVLEETEDTKNLLIDLRTKMMRRIKVFENLNEDKVQIVHNLFDEVDQDGSGSIDKVEFRYLLRALRLTFSNDRFNRLFRAVDTSGDGNLGWDELYALLFPEGHEDEDEEHSHKDAAEVDDMASLKPSEMVNGGNRLRSLSKISDYSDTDSENEKEKESTPSEMRQRKNKEAAAAAAAAADSKKKDTKKDKGKKGADRDDKGDADVMAIISHRPLRGSIMQAQIDRELGRGNVTRNFDEDDDLESVLSDS